MADEILESLIGSTADEEAAAAEAAAKPDAAATTLSLGRRRRKTAGDPAADEYLHREGEVLLKQEMMLDLQIEHLRDHGPLNLKHLQVRRWRDVLQLGLQIFLALAASVAGALILMMLIEAMASRSVIVDPFDAPPSLSARGLTGKVVAGGLLDELTRLQAATRGSAQKRNLSNAWTSDIKVEVPETGVSIGEIDRVLKERLGHDLHIDGALVETVDGGLALTVRGDGILPKTFTGAATDLDKLMSRAGEYVYGQSEPALYSVYLVNSGRNAEAIAFCAAAYAGAPASERPYLLNEWGNAVLNKGGGVREALLLFQTALRLKPDYWTAYSNVQSVLVTLQDEEGAWREGQQMLRLGGSRPGRVPEIYYQNTDVLTWNLQAWRVALVADAESNGGLGSQVSADAPAIADIDVRLHDPVDALLRVKTAPDDPNDPTIAAMAHFVRGRIAEDEGNIPVALNEMETFGTAFAAPEVATNYPGYNCWIAPVEEAAGHSDKADQIFDTAGRFVDCWRFKADVLDHRGDWAGAQKQYAAAIGLAPDLPAAYYSWGLALTRHGDINGAIDKFAAANKRGPHWADPLKAWGDVLARQGKWDEALKKYNEALRWAPAWVELQRARAVAKSKT
ncbi:MAG TPA: tetratricopeptide repeat protein [Caulobacteraceae bacterium]|jgi:tetratricopeptide (TPR) repeat protein